MGRGGCGERGGGGGEGWGEGVAGRGGGGGGEREGIPVDSAQKVNSREDNYLVSPAESATFPTTSPGLCHLTIIRSLTSLNADLSQWRYRRKQRSQEAEVGGVGWEREEGLDITALPAPE